MEQLCPETRNSPTVTKLEAIAQELSDATLVLLKRRGEDVVRLSIGGGPAPLPAFCQLMRTSSKGKRQCMTCRLLLTLAAQFRGSTEYTCHGGMTILACPASGRADAPNGLLVVASCAFAVPDRAQGWKAAHVLARDLDVDLIGLEKAYYALPILTPERKAIMSALVETTAVAIAEIDGYSTRLHARPPSPANSAAAQQRDLDLDLEAEMNTLLTLSRQNALEECGRGAGSALTDLVMGMVKRDPSLPFSVANVARAARMTPNHFSMLFHKYTGVTFTTFLTDQRIEQAKEMLMNPTLTVSEAAYRSGFKDTNYFSRRFKQVTGQSPRQWREAEHAIHTEA